MIPAEAVEAAARAVHEMWMGDQFLWEQVSEEQREEYRLEVRTIIAVILPGRHPYGDSDLEKEAHQVIPDEAVEAAGDVLVYHQRQGIKGCACGWSKPGRSFPEHQARIALEAAAPHLRREWKSE